MPATPGNAINVTAAGLVKFDGSATFASTAITQHDVLVGGASNSVTSVAPSATSGVPLVSGGASADPSFTTAVVAGGGTGQTSFTSHSGLIAAGTTDTGALQNIASVATGQVLTSAGTSTLPSWSATPTVTSITFGSGTALSVYAEGTFTPTAVGATTAGTTNYNVQNGYYTKIGNIVFLTFVLQASSATGTGDLLLGGFPFTVKNVTQNNPVGAVICDNINLPASTVEYVMQALVNTTTAKVKCDTAAGASTNLQIANIGFTIWGNIFYMV